MTDLVERTAHAAQNEHALAALEPFVFLYITEKCQLRCKHCYMGDRLDAERRMSAGLVEEILRTIRVLYGQYKVYLLGGEPTTHPQFDEILDICRRQDFKVVLTSNGLVPERKWRSIRTDRIDSFSFSMDGGRRETHESMRGPNTWSPLLRSMQRAVADGFQTRAIMTVTKENIGDVPLTLSLADEIGLEMLSFHYFTPTGRGRAWPQLQLEPRRWMDLCDRLRQESEHRRVRLFYPPSFVDVADAPRLRAANYRGCTARNLERLAIFPDRRVYICSAFFDTDLHYGEFRDGAIVPRTAPSGENELTLVSRLSANCAGCSAGSVCRGGCGAYDHLRTTLISSECDRQVMPVCPLWSTSASAVRTESRLQDLR